MMSDVQTQEQASLPADLSKQWAEKQFEMFKLKKARQFILNDDLIVEREKVNLDEWQNNDRRRILWILWCVHT